MESRKVSSIGNALDVLDDAARESSAEIKQMISHDYRRLKEILSDVKPVAKSAISEISDASRDAAYEARDRAVKFTKETARQVDESVHENAWYYLAGSALVAGTLGFLLGRKTCKQT